MDAAMLTTLSLMASHAPQAITAHTHTHTQVSGADWPVSCTQTINRFKPRHSADTASATACRSSCLTCWQDVIERQIIKKKKRILVWITKIDTRIPVDSPLMLTPSPFPVPLNTWCEESVPGPETSRQAVHLTLCLKGHCRRCGQSTETHFQD